MTKQELENKIEELQKQLNELKNVKVEEPKKQWRPERGEEYFCVGAGGSINDYTFDDDKFDLDCLNLSNCFRTKEEAQFVADKIKYTQLFKNYVEEHSEPLDWENNRQIKWYIYYDFDNGCIDFEIDDIWKVQGTIYASSEQILKDAITYVGEDNVKKYILEV